MSDSKHFDLIVIGAGSAGLATAAGTAQLGLHTALIEADKMGGDCLNTGCVPSKALLKAAKEAETFRTADKYGITAREPEIDFAAVKDHVHGVIKQIEPHDSQERFEGLGVEVIRGRGRFVDESTVAVDDHHYTARNFIIATGSRAAIPPIDGLDPAQIYTNENIFDLRDKPDHLVIIGGGPIGTEMAQAHARLGCKVSVIDMHHILPRDDAALSAIVREQLQQDGVQIYEQAGVNAVEHRPDGTLVHITHDGQSQEIEGTHLLIAAGRKANIDDMGLEAAGIQTHKTGLVVDKRLRTSNKHVFAAGDVTGGPQFTHIAAYHSSILIRNIVFRLPAKVNYASLPWVTYTDPELANVGLTPDQAREEYGGDKIQVTEWKFSDNDRAVAERRTEGLAKVVTTKKGHILGATICGPGAGEMIGLWGLAIDQKLKIGAVANMIAPYPTYSEISKRLGGAFFTPKLFSGKTRTLVGWLKKIPGL